MKIEAASKNLCEDFFQATGIEPPVLWGYNIRNGEWEVVPRSFTSSDNYNDFSPAYDLDFLITLTPLRIKGIKDTFMLGRNDDNTGWSAVWRDIVSHADKPADAVIVLLTKAAQREQIKKGVTQ